MVDKSGRNYILDEHVAEKKMRRMALEILENNADEKEIILAGIQENGSAVAKTIDGLLKEFADIKTTCIDIALDKRKPGEIKLSKELDFTSRVIILIDDVANSGKTLLYALKPILNFHPKKIQTLVLVERTHKKFPIKPDYVGISIATTLQEHIYVEVEKGRVTGAYME